MPRSPLLERYLKLRVPGIFMQRHVRYGEIYRELSTGPVLTNPEDSGGEFIVILKNDSKLVNPLTARLSHLGHAFMFQDLRWRPGRFNGWQHHGGQIANPQTGSWQSGESTRKRGR